MKRFEYNCITALMRGYFSTIVAISPRCTCTSLTRRRINDENDVGPFIPVWSMKDNQYKGWEELFFSARGILVQQNINGLP